MVVAVIVVYIQIENVNTYCKNLAFSVLDSSIQMVTRTS
jgi:hypothetical protein